MSSSNHSLSSKQRNFLKPTGNSPSSKSNRRGSPIMQKLTALFKRERNTEDGHIPVRPSCFADPPERRRSESPEPAGSNRKRSSSLTNKKLWKAGNGGNNSGVGWRPKVCLQRACVYVCHGVLVGPGWWWCGAAKARVLIAFCSLANLWRCSEDVRVQVLLN